MLEPPQSTAGVVPAHDADVRALLGLPCERRRTDHRAFEGTGERENREQDMIPRGHEIVDHARERASKWSERVSVLSLSMAW